MTDDAPPPPPQAPATPEATRPRPLTLAGFVYLGTFGAFKASKVDGIASGVDAEGNQVIEIYLSTGQLVSFPFATGTGDIQAMMDDFQEQLASLIRKLGTYK